MVGKAFILFYASSTRKRSIANRVFRTQRVKCFELTEGEGPFVDESSAEFHKTVDHGDNRLVIAAP